MYKPASLKKVVAGRTMVKNNAAHSPVSRYLVAAGCFHVSKLQDMYENDKTCYQEKLQKTLVSAYKTIGC